MELTGWRSGAERRGWTCAQVRAHPVTQQAAANPAEGVDHSALDNSAPVP